MYWKNNVTWSGIYKIEVKYHLRLKSNPTSGPCVARGGAFEQKLHRGFSRDNPVSV